MSKPTWISVNEKLPRNDEWVFTCSDDCGHPQAIGIARYHKGHWYDDSDDDEEIGVDYWMPVPTFNSGKTVYLAAPINSDKFIVSQAVAILEDVGFEVYVPCKNFVEHAWDYPNDEWGLMVFQADIEAIKRSDYVVVLSFGRDSTAGTNWEAGYAFGIGKKVIVVDETSNGQEMSVMVANGRYATVEGLAGLESYDWQKMERTRTKTNQK